MNDETGLFGLSSTVRNSTSVRSVTRHPMSVDRHGHIIQPAPPRSCFSSMVYAKA
jgi:hypothetical protein